MEIRSFQLLGRESDELLNVLLTALLTVLEEQNRLVSDSFEVAGNGLRASMTGGSRVVDLACPPGDTSNAQRLKWSCGAACRHSGAMTCLIATNTPSQPLNHVCGPSA